MWAIQKEELCMKHAPELLLAAHGERHLYHSQIVSTMRRRICMDKKSMEITPVPTCQTTEVSSRGHAVTTLEDK